MRNPNGYGSVVKLSGKRRKPYAVRVSTGQKKILVLPNTEDTVTAVYKYGLKYRKAKNDYTVDATDKIESGIKNDGIRYRIEYRRQYQYVEYFERAKDANVYLLNMNSGAEIEKHVPLASEPTFKDVYERYIDFLSTMKKKPSETRLRSYKTGYERWSKLHNLRFRQITTKQLQDILTANGDMSKSSVTRMITILKKMYKYALAHKLCDDDNSQYLFAEHAEKKNSHVPFTLEEIKTLKEHDSDEIAKVALILIYTGMRGSEFLTMKNENIHLEDRYMVGGMKTDAGRDRKIPIHKDIVPYIKSFMRKGNTLLYPNKNGNAYQISKFAELKWNPYMESIGMKHGTHDGRHTCATLMESAGIPLNHRKLILGHKIYDLTEGTYTHVSIEDLIAEVDKIKL